MLIVKKAEVLFASSVISQVNRLSRSTSGHVVSDLWRIHVDGRKWRQTCSQPKKQRYTQLFIRQKDIVPAVTDDHQKNSYFNVVKGTSSVGLNGQMKIKSVTALFQTYTLDSNKSWRYGSPLMKHTGTLMGQAGILNFSLDMRNHRGAYLVLICIEYDSFDIRVSTGICDLNALDSNWSCISALTSVRNAASKTHDPNSNLLPSTL